MKYSAGLICAAIAASSFALAGQKNTHDHELASQATAIDKLYRVTEQPHRMSDSTILLCRLPVEQPHKIHEGYVKAAYCNVYVNEIARKIMQTGKGIYPAGSLIVKSKLPSKDKPDIELFTVMRKMPDTYDPKNGNWEYAIVDGDSQRVLASGRIQSCISCYAAYKETDYVTREYLQRGETGAEAKSQ